jgi:hypothetical protein
MQFNRNSKPVFWRVAPAMALAVVLASCGGGQAPNEAEGSSQDLETADVPLEASAGAMGTSVDEAELWAKGAALNAQELKAASDAEASQPGSPEGSGAAVAAARSSLKATAKSLPEVTVYRFYNRNTSAHFYTASASERDSVRANVPYMTYEGPAFQAVGQSSTGLSPVFRFLNQQTGVHFYTISASERDHIVANLPQYRLEGVAYYASQVAGSGFRPLYRFYRAGQGFHFYTVSGTEAGNVIASLPNYNYEGTAYYVLGTPDAGAPDSPGNHTNTVPVPADGREVDTSQPDRVVGTGTPASCTGQAVVDAVALGGKIRFNCGPSPVTINMPSTAKVFNNRPDVTLDGQGLITLNGGGNVRILYQNTCDPAQVWTTPTCNNQETPRLTVQNMRFVNGNSTGQTTDGGGGGAIFVRGGQFKIINSVFTNNRCETTGPDVGGGAVRALSIYQNRPVYVVQSTFGGGAGLGNSCSNGGALSSIGVSYSVFNSLLSHNSAVGNGANPQRAGTPGGGSGGAIYNDGNTFTLSVYGSMVSDNTAVEGGSAVFYVSNNRTGLMTLSDSTFVRNPASRFGTSGLPGFFVLAAPGQPVVTRTSISY